MNQNGMHAAQWNLGPATEPEICLKGGKVDIFSGTELFKHNKYVQVCKSIYTNDNLALKNK